MFTLSYRVQEGLAGQQGRRFSNGCSSNRSVSIRHNNNSIGEESLRSTPLDAINSLFITRPYCLGCKQMEDEAKLKWQEKTWRENKRNLDRMDMLEKNTPQSYILVTLDLHYKKHLIEWKYLNIIFCIRNIG